MFSSCQQKQPACAADPETIPSARAARQATGVDAMNSRAFDAAIFDMDGVVTDTAAVHSAAWKRMFDEFLRHRERECGEPFREFTHTGDYRAYVDGKPRFEGIASFLQSRGIELPFGTTGDLPGMETIGALGNRKNELFREVLEKDGVKVYASTVALIRELKTSGLRVGLATSSRNSTTVLAKAGIGSLFETIVDGDVLERMRLKGKPSPDIFLTAAANLRVVPGRAVVVEDAVSGVQAGCAGKFGLVIGIAREGNEAELSEAGAGVVVRDLTETGLADIDRCIRERREDGQ
jgi:beta-phosphoglucomutase family hydrolase